MPKFGRLKESNTLTEPILNSKSIVFILLVFAFCNPNETYGQQILDQFYRSSFTPEELNITASERIKKSEAEYLKVYQLPEEEIDGFVLRNNFYLERLNKSGEIFYGDQISAYLNSLKDILLKDSERRNFVHVYLVNYPQINAFTNDFGNIYVNIGTIAKLKTEEQLMTVLAHEISHILLKHSLKTESHIDSLQNVSTSAEFKELEVHQFSQQQELQADSCAYALLKKNGIPLLGVDELFDLLEYNDNPIHDGKIDLSFFIKREYAFEALTSNLTPFSGEIPKVTVPSKTELGTHPTIEKRIELYKHLNSSIDSIQSDEHAQTPFKELKLLAGKIMVNTYMTSGLYVDGLFHTLKLLEIDSTDFFLQKAKFKYMILLTQEKYRGGIGKFLINDHGNESNSREYLTFRQLLVNLSPLDMNILTNIAIEDAGTENDPYIDHLLSVSYQFLYKNNYSMFNAKENRVCFVNDIALIAFEKMHWVALKSLNSQDMNQMTEMENYGFIFKQDQEQIPQLLKQYVSDFSANEKHVALFQEAVQSYVQKQILFERTLTADYLPPTIDPVWMNRHFKSPEFYSRVVFDSTVSTAFVESTTYYLISTNKSIDDVNLAKTIEIEELFNEASFENKLFNYDLSNTSFGDKRTVQSNYNRFSLLTWLNESFTLEDLNFSSVDEEIWQFRKVNTIDYLVFNINIIAQNKGKGSKYMALYCDMYLDLETGGIAYISIIPNQLKPTKKNLKLIQYSSNRQRQIHQ